MNDKAGLSYWAGQVLEEAVRASQNFDPDPVHDLRVALRRCRSMADGFLPVDPDRGWKQMKRSGKNLFMRLGNLRDMQVMEEWVTRLSEPEDSIRRNLLALFASQEAQLKQDAESALRAFDQSNWQALTERLARRTRLIPLEGLVFQHLAAERWHQARDLHRKAMQTRSQVGLHRLRIGIKKFRYLVENFLPQRHNKWGPDLKKLQDLLGEIHDLDVLSGILKSQRSITPAERERWRLRIEKERQERLDQYRGKMLGRHSLWQEWSRDLPQGDRLQEAAMARLRRWGAFLDPDRQHSQHVSQFALQIYDALAREQLLRSDEKQRRILQAAALLHDVGFAKSKRAHHKHSYNLISKLPVPLGWTTAELRAVAAVARYHRGALPQVAQKSLRLIPGSSRGWIIRLAGVLRLANALDLSHDSKVHELQIQHSNGTLFITNAGYAQNSTAAERIAAARHLLEASCQIAVLVRAATAA